MLQPGGEFPKSVQRLLTVLLLALLGYRSFELGTSIFRGCVEVALAPWWLGYSSTLDMQVQLATEP